jgi:quinol monooxygenase YgiN
MAKLDTAKLLPYALGALAGAVLAVALGHILPCPVPLKRDSKGVFVLVVRLKLVPGTVEAFKARWAVLAQHCRSSREPNCLSYELIVNEEDKNTVLIYERYVSKEDLTITHNNGEAFKAFGKWVGEQSGDELLKDGRKSIVLEKSSACVLHASVAAQPLVRPPCPSPSTPHTRTLAPQRISTTNQTWAT